MNVWLNKAAKKKSDFERLHVILMMNSTIKRELHPRLHYEGAVTHAGRVRWKSNDFLPDVLTSRPRHPYNHAESISATHLPVPARGTQRADTWKPTVAHKLLCMAGRRPMLSQWQVAPHAPSALEFDPVMQAEHEATPATTEPCQNLDPGSLCVA